MEERTIENRQEAPTKDQSEELNCLKDLNLRDNV